MHHSPNQRVHSGRKKDLVRQENLLFFLFFSSFGLFLSLGSAANQLSPSNPVNPILTQTNSMPYFLLALPAELLVATSSLNILLNIFSLAHLNLASCPKH